MMMISNQQGEYLSGNLRAVSLMEACTVSLDPLGKGFAFPVGLVRLKTPSGYIHVHNGALRVTTVKDDTSIFMYRDEHLYSSYGGELQLHSNGLNLITVDENRAVAAAPLTMSYGVLPALVERGVARIGDSRVLVDPARELVHKSKHESISNLFELDSHIFSRILQDPMVHEVLERIYPHGYHCSTFSSTVARPGVDKRAWHCDYPYHDMSAPYPVKPRGMQVIWMLDDFTAENGATYVVHGSHRSLTPPCPDKIARVPVGRLTGPRGTVVVMSAKLWHSVGLNGTDSPRAALLANFVPLDVPAKDPIGSQAPRSMVRGGKVVFNKKRNREE